MAHPNHSLSATAGQILASGRSLVVQAPTGAGKTHLAFEEIERTVRNGYRAVYLCPLRALARETSERAACSGRFGGVGLYTGGLEDQEVLPFRDARLLVMTPERLDACTRAWRAHWHWIPEVDLVVIDELHLLGDSKRGARLDGAVTRLRRLNPFVRVLGLSATLGNREELAKLFDAEGIEFTERPVPLEWRVVRFRDPAEKPSLTADEVSRCASQGGRSLVFVQSRRRAETVAKTLAEAGLRVAHHHGGLTARQREQVELACREGALDAVVATATLEMGLNLPVRQVVLHDIQRFDGRSMVPLDVSSVWQRAGRAGRPGLDDRGEAVLLASHRDRDVERYLDGRFEPVRSPLHRDTALAEQIVAEVASGMARTPLQISRAIARSVGGRQAKPPVDRVLAEMLGAEMVVNSEPDEQGRRKLKATKLGKVAARHMLSPKTVQTMRTVLRRDDSPLSEVLFQLACCEECEPHLFVDYEELPSLQPLLVKLGQSLGVTPCQAMGRLSTTGRRLVSSAKATALLLDWARTGDMARACERHGCYEFEVERLRESMVRLLQALGDLAGALDDYAKDCWKSRLAALTAMVQGGIDARCATLTLVGGIGPKTAAKLAAHGIADVEDLALAEPEEVATAVWGSEQRARKWIEAAGELVKTHGAFAFDEQDSRPEVQPRVAERRTVDPYRLRRAMALRVAAETSHRWAVTGGSERRTVSRVQGNLICDCPDHAKGNDCKHILAVRMRLRDRELREQAASLGSEAAGWSAQALWMDRDSGEGER
jgi:helicase